ncbi:MAG: hypothetical protein K5790_10320 [Nitrosopumilus sp.]|uniref:hypothetical protein n=1 Tax=Nitrosopumilus sp. TaxID=2024843 RepID=UPI00247B9391|nr:hypothetical protein [Nitrosopumilus sp.]MCV0393664.1 hypothetical protein [Nitrosopumilus sp.]
MNDVTFVQPVILKYQMPCSDALLDMHEDLLKAQKVLNHYLVNGVTFAVSQKQYETNRFGFSIIRISIRVPMTNHNFDDRIKKELEPIMKRWGGLLDG